MKYIPDSQTKAIGANVSLTTSTSSVRSGYNSFNLFSNFLQNMRSSHPLKLNPYK